MEGWWFGIQVEATHDLKIYDGPLARAMLFVDYGGPEPNYKNLYEPRLVLCCTTKALPYSKS